MPGRILTASISRKIQPVYLDRIVYVNKNIFNTDGSMLVDTTSIFFDTITPLQLFITPNDSVIHRIDVIVDIPWVSGAANLSIGSAQDPTKYMDITENDLYATHETVFSVHPGQESPVLAERLVGTYFASSSSAGAGRIIVYYSVPA